MYKIIMLFFNPLTRVPSDIIYLLAAEFQCERSDQDEGHIHDLHPGAGAGARTLGVTGEEEDEKEKNISQPGRKRQRKRGHK